MSDSSASSHYAQIERSPHGGWELKEYHGDEAVGVVGPFDTPEECVEFFNGMDYPFQLNGLERIGLPEGFEARRCPECNRLTVVDTDYNDQRCDWDVSCGVLFDLEDAASFEGIPWWISPEGETTYMEDPQ